MRKFALVLTVLLGTLGYIYAEEAVKIGTLGTEGELIYPRQIKEGPDGNIYVYDSMDAFIKVYSPEGRFLRKMGGEGQGPGEIQRNDGVSFGFTPDKKLYFTEFFTGHPWITLMELSGKFQKAVKLDIKEFFGVSIAYCLPDGRFLTELNFAGRPEREKDFFYHRSPQEIVLQHADGGIISKIKRADYITRISYESRGADSPIPFSPAFAWCPYKQNTVLFSDGLSTKLQVYNYQGKLIKEIPTPLPEPEKVTRKDLNKWRERRKEMLASRNPDWWNRFGKVIDNYKKSIYKEHPNLSEIAVTPQGNILISGRWDEGKNRSLYWLLDESGDTKADVTSAAGGVSISKSFIFFGKADEDGIITVYAQKRTGSEEEDLLRLK